ncbi:MAG TPA: TolC family protein [Luteolibacter sp.]|nr:TolC family protein [Luteolibacter sp.]
MVFQISGKVLRSSLVPGLALFISSCSTDHYVRSADNEVHGIIDQNQRVVLEETPVPLDISTPFSELNPKYIQPEIIVSERLASEPMRLTLQQAIAISVSNRREYQSEKETLYLVALDLTRARHDYAPKLTSLGSRATYGTAGLKNTSGDFDSSDRDLAVANRASFDQTFITGGALAIDLAQDIFRFYLGGGNPGSTRFLSARLTQPLLRGAGAVSNENLTQRERNVAYAVRNFSRFQDTNVIDITTAYFRILQEKDRVRNEYESYKNIGVFADRARALAEDRLPRFQLDQAKQRELQGKARYISAINSYKNLVDNFKLTLGLPLGGELILDDAPLRSLAEAGLPEIPFDADPAFHVAINHRLDLFNDIDRFEDSKRKIQVAADAFKPGLDLFAGIDLDTNNSTASYSNFDADAYFTRIGVDLDLPVDNLSARNDFRRVKIDFERQIRSLSQSLDRIHADLRSGLRGLELSRETYTIQNNALNLANQRVEGANLLLDAGRATTRDLLDAQSDQLTAQNAVTSALVNYHLTRINLLHDMGVFDAALPQFWVKNPTLPSVKRKEIKMLPVNTAASERLITPDELFSETRPRS